MITKSFIKINNFIVDPVINDKFYYFIENKNKNGNCKFSYNSIRKNCFLNTFIWLNICKLVKKLKIN